MCKQDIDVWINGRAGKVYQPQREHPGELATARVAQGHHYQHGYPGKLAMARISQGHVQILTHTSREGTTTVWRPSGRRRYISWPWLLTRVRVPSYLRAGGGLPGHQRKATGSPVWKRLHRHWITLVQEHGGPFLRRRIVATIYSTRAD